MTQRTCHFHDGCAWPEQYGGEHCDCRRLKLSDFRRKTLREHVRQFLLKLAYRAKRQALHEDLRRSVARNKTIDRIAYMAVAEAVGVSRERAGE